MDLPPPYEEGQRHVAALLHYGGAFAFEMLNHLCILDGNTLRSKLIKPSYFPLYWLFNNLRHDEKGCLQRHG